MFRRWVRSTLSTLVLDPVPLACEWGALPPCATVASAMGVLATRTRRSVPLRIMIAALVWPRTWINRSRSVNDPLMPWESWGPPHQNCTVVRGLLARAWCLSSCQRARREAFWEALVMIWRRGGFPLGFLCTEARVWAYTWVPQGAVLEGNARTCDLEHALACLERSGDWV